MWLWLLGLVVGVPLWAHGAVVETGAKYYYNGVLTEPAMLECGIIRETPTHQLLNGPVLLERTLYGVVATMEFDTSADGRVDTILFWVPGTRLPGWYWFDLDSDQKVDVIFMDHARDGGCGGVKLEWRRERRDQVPHTHPQPQGEGA